MANEYFDFLAHSFLLWLFSTNGTIILSGAQVKNPTNHP